MSERRIYMPALVLMLLACLVCGTAAAAEGADKPKAATAPAVEEEGAAAAPAAEGKEKPTVESRLTALQKALEEVAAGSWGQLPASISDLVRVLPEGKDGLLNPETGKEFIMNPTMERMHERTIRNPKEFMTFWADKDTPDKGRAVIYATRQIKYLNQKDFAKAVQVSKTQRLTREEAVDMREEARARAQAAREAKAESEIRAARKRNQNQD